MLCDKMHVFGWNIDVLQSNPYSIDVLEFLFFVFCVKKQKVYAAGKDKKYERCKECVRHKRLNFYWYCEISPFVYKVKRKSQNPGTHHDKYGKLVNH